MLNFIVLTSSLMDKKLYVNPKQIATFYNTENNTGTVVQFVDGNNYFRVKETPEEIMGMINNLYR